MLTQVRVDPRPSDHNIDAGNIGVAKLSKLEFGTKFQREVAYPFVGTRISLYNTMQNM